MSIMHHFTSVHIIHTESQTTKETNEKAKIPIVFRSVAEITKRVKILPSHGFRSLDGKGLSTFQQWAQNFQDWLEERMITLAIWSVLCLEWSWTGFSLPLFTQNGNLFSQFREKSSHRFDKRIFWLWLTD